MILVLHYPNEILKKMDMSRMTYIYEYFHALKSSDFIMEGINYYIQTSMNISHKKFLVQLYLEHALDRFFDQNSSVRLPY